MNTLTRSNAATRRFVPLLNVLDCSEVYLPTIKLLFKVLHVIFSGFFFEAGVKNADTAAWPAEGGQISQ